MCVRVCVCVCVLPSVNAPLLLLPSVFSTGAGRQEFPFPLKHCYWHDGVFLTDDVCLESIVNTANNRNYYVFEVSW